MARIFAYIMHRDGVADDTAAQLAAAAIRTDPSASPTAIVAGSGPDLEAVCSSVSASYAEVWKIANGVLARPNAEFIRRALIKIIPPGSIVLIPHDHFGIDLSPGLSIKLNASYVPDVVAIDGIEGSELKVVRQEFGGQVSAHVRCDLSSGAVVTIRPGAFKPSEGAAYNRTVVDKSANVGAIALVGRRYIETIVPEAGAVDITKHAVLVSVGRGIQGKENIGIAEELAAALGGVVSCSRPVVDAQWLEKSRQVGSSGKTVKPKVYLACGISGAFQHVAGLQGHPFIVAINKNPKAPIFRLADVGIVDDILEFLPELTDKVREMCSVSAKQEGAAQ
jgi:electron transfer flavoprotein alpha subunit